MSLSLLSLLACSPYPYPGEEGSVLHVGLRTLPKTLDPAQLDDQSSAKLSAPVYEGLLTYHPYARPYQLEPSLAVEMPELSEDQLTWTFTLRDDLRFADDPCFPGGEGRAVSAEDVLYSFLRFSHPDTRSKGWWLFDGWIAGLNAWRDDLASELSERRLAGEEVEPLWGLDRPVEGFQVLDERRFQIQLTQPYPQLLWVLAMPYTSVYPQEAVEHYGDRFRHHPVGTGPFILEEFHPSYRAVYRRNPDYRERYVPDPVSQPEERWPGWEEDVEAGLLVNAGEQVPLLDGIEVRFILEDQPRWLYFKAGYLDFLNPPKDNTAEAIPGGELSEEMQVRGVSLTPLTELGTVYTSLNTQDEVLSNVNLRRAISLAINHDWTIEHLYAGQAHHATSLIPPGVEGYDPAPPPYRSVGEPDLTQVAPLLEAAGYPGGVDPETGKALRVRFESSGSSVTNRQFAQRFVDELRRIGLDVEVVVNTFPQMVEKMRKGQFQIAGLAWGFDYPDAQNILQLLYGPNRSPGINSANFDDPEYNALYEASSTLSPGPERAALYEQMAAIVADQVPWITRVHRVRQNLQQPWLQGFKYTEVTDSYWVFAAVDEAQRAELVADWNRPVRWPLFLLGGVGAALVLLGRGRRS